MPNLICETTERSREECTDISQKTIDRECQKIVIDFLRAELDLAFTMLSIAMETGLDADRGRFLSVAPNSINSVCGFGGRITDSSDIEWLRAQVRILESAVKRLKSVDATRRRIGRAVGRSAQIRC